MSETRWHEAIFLGGGGNRPCLDIVYPDGQVSRLLDLSPGQSVYTMDRRPEDNSLALGTRAGQILVISDPRLGDGARIDTLVQGAPVLSCCWTGDGQLVASDLAGRVLLWKLDDPANPMFLDAGKEVTCALCMIEKDMVAGLSVAGSINLWRLNSSRPASCLASQPPPSKFALVKLGYLASRRELVHPGRDGELISLQLDGDSPRRLNAHNEDFYAFSLGEDGPVTAGLGDRTLKVWPSPMEGAAAEYALSQGLIQLVRFPDHPGLMAAIAEDGSANLLEINGGQLSFHGIGSTGSYRYATRVMSPSQLLSTKRQKAGQAAADLEAALSQDDAASVDACHQRLAKLGFEHVALAARSAWHIKQGEYLSALRHSARLMDILPKKDTRSFQSMQRYADLLVRYGLFYWAMKLYNQMEALDSTFNNPLGELKTTLDRQAELEIIIDTSVALDEIIEAHTILCSSFQGTYILSKQDPYRCPKLPCHNGELADQLNRELASAGRAFQAHAAAVKSVMLSCNSFRIEEVIKLESPSDNHIPICFGLLISTTMSHTNVTPMVLMSWLGGQGYRENNRDALGYLEHLRSQDTHLDYLDFAYRIAMDFVRRMATEAQTTTAAAI